MKRKHPQNKSWNRNLGTPAHQDLLAKDPALATGFRQEQAAYRKRLSQLRTELAGDREITGNLDRLKRAGAGRDKVLRVLAFEIEGKLKRKQRGHALAEIRRRNHNLRSLATSLESIASQVETVYADPTTHPEIFVVALQRVADGRVTPASESPARNS